jgi:potassium efflux system protein
MLQLTKHYRVVRALPEYRQNNFDITRILLCLVLLILLAPVSAAPASSLINKLMNKTSSNPDVAKSQLNPAVLIEEIKKKLAATKAELALVPSEAAADSTATGLSEDEDIIARRLRLRQLVFLYQGQLARLESLQVRQQRLSDLENQVANWSGFSEPLLHPFLKADELKESVNSLKSRVGELESWITALDVTGEQIISTAEESTVKLRQADEAVEKAKNSPGQALLSRERDQLVLQNQVDLARAMGFQVEKQTVQEELQETRANLQLARKQLGMVPEKVELTQQDIDQLNKNIEKASQHVIAELKQAVSVFDGENKAAKQERQELGVAEDAAKPETLTKEQLDQIHQVQLITADLKLQALNRILVYLQMQRDIWNVRWLFAKVTDREKAGEAYDRIAQNQKVLKATHEYINQQRHSRLTLLTNESVWELDPAVTGPDVLRDELRNLDLEQVVSYSRFLGAIEATENLLERFKQELDERFRVKSFYDYLEEAWLTTRDVASQIWEFELFAVQDNIEVDGQIISGKRSITVDKVVSALAILFVGYWFAVRLARLLENQAVTHWGMDESLARIARRWILFLEVLLLVILSMMVVKIPLTIFAFMGGALAIGVGVGMQNLLKNLISGLMLLFERPFRPGDLVEVGGIRGRVLDIGVRSSHIRDTNGIETLIPNSTFIEQNVTNWTLSNEAVRIVVKVGVAYGSPVKEVSELLLDVAARHGLVEDDPEPQVQFEDFGSDALLFGLYIWIQLKPEVSWMVVASDLRYMINKTLTEKGIVISFPQRDIHLDTSRPLEVRVLADTPDAGNIKK